MAEDASRETLTGGLTLLVKVGRVLLETAEKDVRASLETFVPHKVTTLYGLLTAGAHFYRSLGVKTKHEAETLWQESYHHDVVRERVEELLKLERDWDSFLERVDRGLQTADAQGSGSEGPAAGGLCLDTALTDWRSGKAVSLRQYLGPSHKLLLVLITHFGCLSCRDHVAELEANQAALEAQSVRVLVLSSGSAEGARLWLEQTGCRFEMLLDPQRKIYGSLGLGSSCAQVMKFGRLLRDSEYGAAGRDFPDVPPRLLGDIFQLGGDFLVDGTGRLLLSQPWDRPTAVDVLRAAGPTA